jgi:hypothetical protein
MYSICCTSCYSYRSSMPHIENSQIMEQSLDFWLSITPHMSWTIHYKTYMLYDHFQQHTSVGLILWAADQSTFAGWIYHRQSPSTKAWKCGEFPAPRAHTLRVGNYLVIYSITTGEQQSCKLHVSIIRHLITPGSMIQNRQSLPTN